jgi:hypothetical protein
MSIGVFFIYGEIFLAYSLHTFMSCLFLIYSPTTIKLFLRILEIRRKNYGYNETYLHF